MSDQTHPVEVEPVSPTDMAPDGSEATAVDTSQAVDQDGENPTDDVSMLDGAEDSSAITRPDDVPEKFWDTEAGAMRTDTLLKSYLELERKLGTMVPLPKNDDPTSRHKLQRALGKPEAADDYQIEPTHELITSDPTVNAKLHEAGFSSEQAQLVYDLAAEHLVPLIEEAGQQVDQQAQRAQLTAQFGGEEKWQALAPQIKTWAEANLSDDVYASLGSSADGVVAIYHMMQAREPSVISEAAVPEQTTDERQLSEMMRDPRYWRERDPAYVAEVTAGYRRLYG